PVIWNRFVSPIRSRSWGSKARGSASATRRKRAFPTWGRETIRRRTRVLYNRLRDSGLFCAREAVPGKPRFHKKTRMDNDDNFKLCRGGFRFSNVKGAPTYGEKQ